MTTIEKTKDIKHFVKVHEQGKKKIKLKNFTMKAKPAKWLGRITIIQATVTSQKVVPTIVAIAAIAIVLVIISITTVDSDVVDAVHMKAINIAVRNL